MSARSRLQRLERASGPEPWFVATEAAAAELREEARREGRPTPNCIVLNDAMADPPIRCRLRDDRVYIQTWSVWLDLKILARTPLALIRSNAP